MTAGWQRRSQSSRSSLCYYTLSLLPPISVLEVLLAACMHCSLCTTPLLALLESPCSPLLCSALFSYPLTQHNMVCVQCTPFGCSMRAVGASSWSMITSPSLSNMVALFSLTPNHARSSGCQCSRRPSRSYTAHTHPCELSQPAHCTTTISSSAYNS